MACRVRSSSMTLKDFHDRTPGQASAGLPSKPAHVGGFVHDSMDVESVESRFSDMSLSPFGGYGSYAHSDGQMSGSPYKANGSSMLTSPNSAMGMRKSDLWGAQRAYERPLGSYGRQTRSGEPHDGEFMPMPPPPPPRHNSDWKDDRGFGKQSGLRTPDSEGHESSFHYDVQQLPSHDDYTYRNHHASQVSDDVLAEPTWKATGRADPDASGSRPKLQLQPRSAPAPAGSNAGRTPKQAAADGQRPKLQLQPRSKPLESSSVRQSSLFGAARPREEVLKVITPPIIGQKLGVHPRPERGVDPVAVEAAPSPQQAAILVKASRSALVGIQPAPNQGGSDWQTVGPKRGQHSYSQGSDYLHSGGDVLLSQTAPTRPYYHNNSQSYESGGYSGYGPSHGRYVYGEDEADEGDPTFPGRRSLPTRADLF